MNLIAKTRLSHFALLRSTALTRHSAVPRIHYTNRTLRPQGCIAQYKGLKENRGSVQYMADSTNKRAREQVLGEMPWQN